MRSGASPPTGSGGRFAGAATVTVNVCVADVFEPPASVAVTVTTAAPSDIGVTVTVLPETVAVATAGDDEVAP